jgi:hypothetical protein
MDVSECMRWLAGLSVVAMAVAVAALAGSRESGQSSAGQCLSADDASVSGSSRPAVIALLGDELDGHAEFSGPHVNRLLRISLPGGEVQRERTLGRRLPNRAITRDDSFRLNMARAPLLGTTPDGRTVVALMREPAPGRDSVAVVDAASLETRCTHPLESGVRYLGLLLGRSGRVYAFGIRRAQTRGGWDAVLTILDAESGALAGAKTVRDAERGKRRGFAKQWFIYGAALSADERRIVLSYHGRDTTGADHLRISAGSRVSHGRRGEQPCVRRRGRRVCASVWTDVEEVHGAVRALRSGFVGTAGEEGLVHLDRSGRLIRRIPITPRTHLMDFASDARLSMVYVSSCGTRAALYRFDLERGRRETVAGARFCGHPLAVHDDRFLVLIASRLNNAGDPAGPPRRLRLVDLEADGSARLVQRPGAPLDAVVVARAHR